MPGKPLVGTNRQIGLDLTGLGEVGVQNLRLADQVNRHAVDQVAGIIEQSYYPGGSGKRQTVPGAGWLNIRRAADQRRIRILQRAAVNYRRIAGTKRFSRPGATCATRCGTVADVDSNLLIDLVLLPKFTISTY